MQDERPALTKHQLVVAKAVAAMLEPLLTEINRKLDVISGQMETLLAALATTAARVEDAARRTGTAPRELPHPSRLASHTRGGGPASVNMQLQMR